MIPKSLRLTIPLALLLAFGAAADTLNVNSILSSFKAGVSPDALVASIRDPANTVIISAADLDALRTAGVPEMVVVALQQRVGTTPPASVAPPAAPDDPRLAEVVRLTKSGISESIIAQQIDQSGIAYALSMNDLLYLKQNGVQDSVISALLATKDKAARKAAEPPAEIVFNDLLLSRGWGPMHRERPGRLTLRGDTFSWIDGSDPRENFDFKVSGLDKIWYTCQAQTSGDVCYQINFSIARGPHYSFVDVKRASGANPTVTAVMETLRKEFPRAPFAAADH